MPNVILLSEKIVFILILATLKRKHLILQLCKLLIFTLKTCLSIYIYIHKYIVESVRN